MSEHTKIDPYRPFIKDPTQMRILDLIDEGHDEEEIINVLIEELSK